MIKSNYTDENGMKRRVFIPDETPDIDLKECLPASVMLDSLILGSGASSDFLRKLYNELWAVELIEPADFLKPGADTKIRAALLAAIKIDVQAIQRVAKEQKRA